MKIPRQSLTNSVAYKAWFRLLVAAFLVAGFMECRPYRKNNPRGKYFHGYIVFSATDSIEGKIKVRPSYEKKVVIKPEGASGKKSFPVEDIERMRINLIRYGKISVDGKPRLLEKVAYGVHNLYAYNQMVKDQIKTFYYFEIEPGDVVTLTRDNYLSVLEDYLIGVPEIENRFYNEDVRFDEVIEVVRLYNRKMLKN